MLDANLGNFDDKQSQCMSTSASYKAVMKSHEFHNRKGIIPQIVQKFLQPRISPLRDRLPSLQGRMLLRCIQSFGSDAKDVRYACGLPSCYHVSDGLRGKEDLWHAVSGETRADILTWLIRKLADIRTAIIRIAHY